MSDLLHKDVPAGYVEAVASVMVKANWHTYQVLTKRAERLRELLETRLCTASGLSHIWWGVSVENKTHGLPRVAELRKAPAAVRFLSIEPLLEDLGQIDLSGIHWVIVGGESGPGAREMCPEWVRSILGQCREQNVPFFFKQWGGVRKGKAGRELDGETYDEFPTRIQNPVAGGIKRMVLISQVEAISAALQASGLCELNVIERKKP
jgi:protein gp37